MSDRRGFTFIELLVVVTILGILANLALPALTTLRTRAEAAHVIGDFEAVGVGALDHFTAKGFYPPTGAWGVVPPDLVAGLPANFTFAYKDAQYRWHNWLPAPQ